MDALKDCEAAFSLGQRITEELEIRSGVDTLSKWMSHHLASLMLAASEETDATKKSSLEKQCCQLIQHLWEKREHMPRGVQPLGRLEDVLEAFLSFKNERDEFSRFRQQHDTEESPWLNFAKETYTFERRISSISLLMRMLEADIGREQRWRAENADALSEEEASLLKFLDGWMGDVTHSFLGEDTKSTTSLPSDEREAKVLSVLEKAIQDQADAFSKLKLAITERGTEASPQV